MFFDTHAHYDDEAFDGDREELLALMPGAGIGLIMNPGSDMDSSLAAVRLCDRHEHVYAAVGWHPHEADSFGADSAALIADLSKKPKVMAIGEIGLDYHYDYSPRDRQKEVFTMQMELAAALKLPVIVHDREAHRDCMDIIKRFPDIRGVFHCYSGSAEMARDILELGWYLSFTGAITFNNARKALDTIKMMPDDRIMIETDAPYLAPVPKRGKRNDSRFLPLIAKVIGDVRGIGTDEVEALTLENGRRFFSVE